MVVAQYGSLERTYFGTRFPDYPSFGTQRTDEISFLDASQEGLEKLQKAINDGSKQPNCECCFRLRAPPMLDAQLTSAIVLAPADLDNVKTGHDSRYFIVEDETLKYQAVNLLSGTPKQRDKRLAAAYDELIFSKPGQLLPFALFYFKPRGDAS